MKNNSAKVFADTTSALAMARTQRTLLAETIVKRDVERAKEFNARAAKASPEERAKMIASAAQISAASMRKSDEASTMLSTVLGAPIDASPIRGGIIRNILQPRTLGPAEAAEIDTDPNNYEALWVANINGAIRRTQIDRTRTAIDMFKLSTDVYGVDRVLQANTPWDIVARVSAKLVEAMDNAEDTYLLELTREALAVTSAGSDDHYVTRDTDALSQTDAIDLLGELLDHGGAAALYMGKAPYLSILKWGIETTNNSSTIFTPNTREQIIRTLSVGTLGGANVYYDPLLDTENSGSYAQYVYAYCAPAQVGYVLTREVNGVARSVDTDYDIATTEDLMKMYELFGASIANPYGVACNKPA